MPAYRARDWWCPVLLREMAAHVLLAQRLVQCPIWIGSSMAVLAQRLAVLCCKVQRLLLCYACVPEIGGALVLGFS